MSDFYKTSEKFGDGVKKCSSCQTNKPISEFSKHSKNKDGLRSQCKHCARADWEKWYSKNKELVSARDKERYRSNRESEIQRSKDWQERNMDHVIEYRKKSRQTQHVKMRRVEEHRREMANHPEKRIAYNLMKVALLSGDLIRKPCEVCGDVKSQGHHDDYTKPLEVRWLCHAHHCEVHGKKSRTNIGGINVQN